MKTTIMTPISFAVRYMLRPLPPPLHLPASLTLSMLPQAAPPPSFLPVSVTPA